MADQLVPRDVRRTRARAATLVDATFMGLQLDQQVDDGEEQRRAIRDLAKAVAGLWADSVQDQVQDPTPAATREPAGNPPRNR